MFGLLWPKVSWLRLRAWLVPTKTSPWAKFAGMAGYGTELIRKPLSVAKPLVREKYVLMAVSTLYAEAFGQPAAVNHAMTPWRQWALVENLVLVRAPWAPSTTW